MRIKTRDDKTWHKTFALLPRHIGHEWVWLEQCWRRWKPGITWPTFGHWEYHVAEKKLFAGELCEVMPPV